MPPCCFLLVLFLLLNAVVLLLLPLASITTLLLGSRTAFGAPAIISAMTLDLSMTLALTAVVHRAPACQAATMRARPTSLSLAHAASSHARIRAPAWASTNASARAAGRALTAPNFRALRACTAPVWAPTSASATPDGLPLPVMHKSSRATSWLLPRVRWTTSLCC